MKMVSYNFPPIILLFGFTLVAMDHPSLLENELELHETAQMDEVDDKKLQLLAQIARGEIDAQDCFGNTALLLAVKERRADHARLLVSNGASLKICNNKGRDVFYYALKKCDNRIEQLSVIDAIMDDSKQDQCRLVIAELVKSYSLEYDSVYIFNNLFFNSLQADCLCILEGLILQGYDIGIPQGFVNEQATPNILITPIVFAGISGHARVFNFLYNQGADRAACDSIYQRTAIHWAALAGKLDFFEGLIMIQEDWKQNQFMLVEEQKSKLMSLTKLIEEEARDIDERDRLIAERSRLRHELEEILRRTDSENVDFTNLFLIGDCEGNTPLS